MSVQPKPSAESMLTSHQCPISYQVPSGNRAIHVTVPSASAQSLKSIRVQEPNCLRLSSDNTKSRVYNHWLQTKSRSVAAARRDHGWKSTPGLDSVSNSDLRPFPAH